MKKVLISAPLAGIKQYAMNDWLGWIATQTYENFEVCVCINGKEQKELEEKLSQVEITYPDNTTRRLMILNLPESNNLSTIQKITYSRERIRRFAIAGGYDYIFFLDNDTIPSSRDAISKLMSYEKDCISGLYFYKNTKQPVIIDSLTNTNISLDKCQVLAESDSIYEVWGFGFGCLLLSRKAFIDKAFDYGLFGEERTDDFGYCHVLEQSGIKRYFCPLILCKHIVDSESTKNNIGTKLPFLIHGQDKDRC